MAVASVAGRPPALVAGLVLGRAVTQATGLLEGASFSGGTDTPSGESSRDVGLSRDMPKHHAQAVRMSVLHQGGVAMAEEAAPRAEEPQVRRLAKSIVGSQTAQIAVLQSMLAARGGPADGS